MPGLRPFGKAFHSPMVKPAARENPPSAMVKGIEPVGYGLRYQRFFGIPFGPHAGSIVSLSSLLALPIIER